MKKFLDISYWRAVARNPAAVTGQPMIGVFLLALARAFFRLNASTKPESGKDPAEVAA